MSLLAHGVHKRKTVETLQPAQINEFKVLLEIYSKDNSTSCAPTMEELLSWLCDIINQSNLVQLPGIVAAALSERAPPTSSTLRDHERLLNGRALDLPAGATEITEWPNSALPNVRERSSDKLSLQGQAKELSRDIAIELQGYKTSKASECAKNLRSICDTYKNKVSSSMMLLGYWIADLTATGKSKNRKKINPYALKSLTTYFSSLSPVFRELLYEVDLIAQDSEEMTELCVQMLDHKVMTSKHADYFGKRLKDFFRWAARFGVASPEWADLDLDSGYRTVSAGLISETEYQECQTRIVTDNALSKDEQLILGFVLLTTYRFGLRLKEAVGMLRRDWCQHEQLIWVLVQGNQYRSLKSQASRRAIPLLFKLSQNEQDIVDRTFARYNSIAGKQNNRPVLCEASNQESGQPALTRLAQRISPALIRLMRSVTGNPQIVLHHCRHSFYNRVAPALFGLNNTLADKLTNTAGHDQIRQIVLGSVSHVSRRSGMALARLMGHRFPSTGLKNYFHLATGWADELTPVTHFRAHKIENILQVSEQSIVTIKPAQSMAEVLSYPKPTLARLLQALRLVSLGMGYERAGELMHIETQHISRLQKLIETTNERMRFSSKVDKRIKLKGSECPNALLESITDAGWQRLLHRADELADEAVLAVKDNSIQNLEDLPYMVSPNRHILMEQSEHCALVKHVIELFEIPATQYQIIAKEKRPGALRRLLIAAGFGIVTEIEAGIKLDGFTIFLTERNSEYRINDYAGLVLSRSATGAIRNSFELVIALLATGFLMQLDSES